LRLMDVIRETPRAELREFFRDCCEGLDDAFRLLDVRCAGQLRQEDFLQGLSVLGYPGDALEMFFAIDTNYDGIVTPQDFITFFTADVEETLSHTAEEQKANQDAPAFCVSDASSISHGIKSRSSNSAANYSLPASSGESSRVSLEFNVLKLELRRMQAERQEQHAAMIQAIRTGIDESLQHEVDRAVSEAFEQYKQSNLPVPPRDPMPPGSKPEEGLPMQPLMTPNSLNKKLQGVSDQMQEFSSTLTGFAQEIAKVKEHTASLDGTFNALMRDQRSTTIMARRAVDMITETKEDRPRVEACLDAMEAALNEELSKLRCGLESHTSSFSELHQRTKELQQTTHEQQQNISEDKRKIKLLFDTNAILSMRVDELREHKAASASPDLPKPQSVSDTASGPTSTSSGRYQRLEDSSAIRSQVSTVRSPSPPPAKGSESATTSQWGYNLGALSPPQVSPGHLTPMHNRRVTVPFHSSNVNGRWCSAVSSKPTSLLRGTSVPHQSPQKEITSGAATPCKGIRGSSPESKRQTPATADSKDLGTQCASPPFQSPSQPVATRMTSKEPVLQGTAQQSDTAIKLLETISQALVEAEARGSTLVPNGVNFNRFPTPRVNTSARGSIAAPIIAAPTVPASSLSERGGCSSPRPSSLAVPSSPAVGSITAPTPVILQKTTTAVSAQAALAAQATRRRETSPLFGQP
jgi:hypothetical protein